MVKVITAPSTVPLTVVANALNWYSVSGVKPLTVAARVVPVAETFVQSAAAVAFYMKPCAVIVSLPAVIVPFNVAEL